MKFKLVIAVLMGIAPFRGLAGVEHGNGGGVIICQNDS